MSHARNARTSSTRSTHSRVVSAALASAAVLAFAYPANASPLLNFTFLGRVQGTSDPFSPTVAVAPGDLLEYQISVDMAPIGTTNTQGAITRTITSLTSGPDGIQSLNFDLFQLSTDAIQVDFPYPSTLNPDPSPAPNDTWAGFGDFSGGTPDVRPATPYNDLTFIRPIHPAGVFSAIDPEPVISGIVAVPSTGAGTTSLLRQQMRTGSGGFHINGNPGTLLFSSTTNQNGADPYMGVANLTLVYNAAAAAARPTWSVDASGNWSDSANWTNGPANAPASFANFTSAINAPRTITLDTPVTVGCIALDNPNSYTIAGSNALTMNAPGAYARINVLSGQHAISTPIVLATDLVASAYSPTAHLKLSGPISGNASLATSGTGVIELASSNSYSGPTNLNGAIILASAPSALGDGSATNTLNFNSGTLRYGAVWNESRPIFLNSGAGTIDTNGFDVTLSSTRSGGGSFTKTGSGTLTVAGASAALGGGTTVNAGTLRLGSGASISNGTVNVNSGATLDLNSFDVSVGAITGTGAVNLGAGSLTLRFGTATTYSGVISGTGGLSMAVLGEVGGGGTLILANTNLYTGPTAINRGTISAAAPNIFPFTSALSVSSTFSLNGFNQTIGTLSGTGAGGRINLGAATLTTSSNTFSTFPGVISGTGALVKTGAGTLVLTGANSYTGATNINAGVIRISTLTNLGSTANTITFDGGTLQFGATLSDSRKIVLNPGGATVDTNGFNATFAGAISGSGTIAKVGTGTLRISGSSNTYTGDSIVNSGTLDVSSDASLGGPSGTLVLAGGTFRGGGSFNRALRVTSAGGALSNVSTLTFAGSGNTSLLGDLNIDSVTFARTGGTTVVAAGRTATVTGSLNLGGTVDPLSDGTNHARIVTNTSTSTLNITNSAKSLGDIDGPGKTVLSSGTLLTAGHLRQSGVTLNSTSSLLQRPGGVDSSTSVIAALSISGSNSAWTSKYDLSDNDLILQNLGSGTNGQSVTARTTNQLKQGLTGNTQGITSSIAGTSMTLGVIQNNKLSAANQAGSFTNGTTSDASSSSRVYTAFSGQPVSLNDTIVAYTYFGDANLDGLVNSTDYNLIDSGFSTSSSGWINGDFDYSGSINSTDYFLIDATYLSLGNTLSQSTLNQRLASFGQGYLDYLTTTPIPEPSALIFLLPLALQTRRYRRRDARPLLAQ